MSSLIELAAEFLDRVSNPAFGAGTNEEYSLRLAALLDGELEQRLGFEASQLRSTDALTPFGWTWLLGWAKSTDAELDRALLIELCEEWESVAFKAAVIDAATIHSEAEAANFTSDVRDFPDLWLRTLLSRAVSERRGDPRALDEDAVEPLHLYSRHSHSLLMALVFVDRPVTLDAASALLHQPWVGQKQLVASFWSRMEDLDSETREAWQDRLDPPPLSQT